PKDIAEHTWAGFRLGVSMKMQSAGESAVLQPHGRIIGDDMAFVREVLRNGAGIGALPTYLAAADVAAGSLVTVLPRWAHRTGFVWFVTPAARQLPRKVAAYRAMVME